MKDDPADLAPVAPLDLSYPWNLSGFLTLLRLSVIRTIRGRRLVVLCALFALPAAIAVLARRENPSYSPAQAEQALIFYLIPQALVPLTALLLASGMVQDEVEEQTMTYLLMRPLPRWSIYLAKLFATLFVAGALTAVLTTATFVAVYWNTDDLRETILPGRALQTSALLCLSLLAYGAIFGFLGLWVRRALALGVSYVVLFEGVFANIDFAVRKLTVMYYFRVLVARWVGLEYESWSMVLAEAPDSRECVLTLLAAFLVATAAGAFTFGMKEFRVKTPEGN